MIEINQQEIIENMFKKGLLINKELLNKEIDLALFKKIKTEKDLLVLNSDYLDIVHQDNLIDWQQIDQYRVKSEKKENQDLYLKQLENFTTITTIVANNNNKNNNQNNNQNNNIKDDKNNKIEIIYSYQNNPHKYVVNDFTKIFVSRYRFIESILRNRRELQQTLTINRLLEKKEKEKISIIGIIQDIHETKKGNLLLTLEDLTGQIKVLINKNKENLYTASKDLVVDEIIGVIGNSGDRIIFAEDIVWPDIPHDKELKKGNEDEYVIFLSDIHVGSNLFLEKEFKKFLQWIKGSTGNEIQREIAQKVKYILIAGDLVDGIGIYPAQEEELIITDIKQQYQKFAELINLVPLDKQIIICPGNHDMTYLAEPQPLFYQKFAPDLFNLPHVTLVTNPALINIGKTANFSGFDVLLYHGSSFDYYIANVESIRNQGGYHRADLIMKFLLRRRHLAPSFKSTPYFPGHLEDPLLIKKIPDFFVTGHIHYSNVANYHGITLISGSCWQGKTSYQEKLGHEPEPGRVPVVNLKTREIKILKFI